MAKRNRREKVESYIYHAGKVSTYDIMNEFGISSKEAGVMASTSGIILCVGETKIPNYDGGGYSWIKNWENLELIEKEGRLSYLGDLYMSKTLDKRSRTKVNRYFNGRGVKTLSDILEKDPWDRAPHKPEPEPSPFKEPAQ